MLFWYKCVLILTSCVILIGSTVTIRAIRNGSRSKFAYELMAYSVVLGLVYFGYFLVYQFPLILTYVDYKTGEEFVDQQSQNFRIYITLVIVQFAMTVQDWMFCNKFLMSALIFEGLYKKKQMLVSITYYVILVTYILSLIIIWCIFVFTFPGYVVDGTNKAYKAWILPIYVQTFNTLYAVFAAFNSSCIIVMIISIFKLNRIVKKIVDVQGDQINENKFAMKLYIAVICIRVITVYLRASIFWSDKEKLYIEIDIILALSDMIYQLALQFAVRKMGASINLRNFECHVNDDPNGLPPSI